MDGEEDKGLRERVKKLAIERSHLQLVVDMMNRLNKAPGLENTLQGMIFAVLENIGGEDAFIYCIIDKEIYRESLSRGLEKVAEIDDAMAAEAFRCRAPVEREHTHEDTIMRLSAFGHTWSLAYPLKMGAELIGVFKINNLHLDVRAMGRVLPVFFDFATLVLINELLGRTQLKQAYDKLSVSNRELLKTKTELEFQVQERTEAIENLTFANLELEKRTTALERANKELEQANLELESFSYSMSHDLRTPLRAIDGFTRLVLEDFSETLGEEGRRYMGLVLGGATRMAQLIDDLLAFFRLSRREPSLKTIDVANLAKEVAEKLRLREQEARRIDFRIGALPPAHCDEPMIRQVLMSLIANALKFTAPRDDAMIEIAGVSKDGETIYSIKDNGVGFDDRFSHKLFGVFQRLHGTDEFEGTGMGLAIVKRIVERHGGRVWATSKVGEGATFYFALPNRN
jgi:signal transduction histidine kinase